MDTTLIGALLGFMAAVMPAVFNALAEYFERRNELAITAQKIDAQTKGVTVAGPGPVVTYTAEFSVPPSTSQIRAATEAATAPDEPLPVPISVPPAEPISIPQAVRTRVFKAVQDEPRRRSTDFPDDDEADLDAGRGKVLFIRLFATMRAAVRPLITYGFFLLFVYVKLKGMEHALYVDHTPAISLLPVLWDEGTQALFAAVLAFWFGSRAIERQAEAKIAAAAKVSAGDNP